MAKERVRTRKPRDGLSESDLEEITKDKPKLIAQDYKDSSEYPNYNRNL